MQQKYTLATSYTIAIVLAILSFSYAVWLRTYFDRDQMVRQALVRSMSGSDQRNTPQLTEALVSNVSRQLPIDSSQVATRGNIRVQEVLSRLFLTILQMRADMLEIRDSGQNVTCIVRVNDKNPILLHADFIKSGKDLKMVGIGDIKPFIDRWRCYESVMDNKAVR